MSNVEDDNNQGEINTKHRNYNADNDDVSEFYTNDVPKHKLLLVNPAIHFLIN